MSAKDAQKARKWAEAARDGDLRDPSYAVGYQDAVNYLLENIKPESLTMAEIEWNTDEHSGLCAKHPHYGLVRMTHRDGDGDICFLADPRKFAAEWCWSVPWQLTPIPGTRVDLTPRLPEDDQWMSDANAESTKLITEKMEDSRPEFAFPCPEYVPLSEVWAVDIGLEGEWIGVRCTPDGALPWRVVRIDEADFAWRSDSDITLLHRLTPEASPTVADHPRTLTTTEDYESAPWGTIVAIDNSYAFVKGASGWYHLDVKYSSDVLADHERVVMRWGWKA